MKTHTTQGKMAFEKIIQETGGTRWLYFAKDIAYCHHERWDGSGYPNGLKGEEIPLYARMLTIADVYDALTSERAYKKEFSHEKATKIIIEGKGTYFDPYLVDLFIKANKKFEEMLLRNKTVDAIERK
jgi:putative two-component system response regulator